MAKFDGVTIERHILKNNTTDWRHLLDGVANERDALGVDEHHGREVFLSCAANISATIKVLLAAWRRQDAR